MQSPGMDTEGDRIFSVPACYTYSLSRMVIRGPSGDMGSAATVRVREGFVEV